MLYVLTGAALVALDQLSKALVGRAIPAGGVRPVIPGVLSLRPVANSGAAFGVLPQWTAVFIFAAIVFLGLALHWYRKLTGRRPAAKVGLTLAAAGAAGNLLDRVRFGFVRDFLDLRGYPAIFNVADVAIVAGIGLLAFALWREEAR